MHCWRKCTEADTPRARMMTGKLELNSEASIRLSEHVAFFLRTANVDWHKEWAEPFNVQVIIRLYPSPFVYSCGQYLGSSGSTCDRLP